MRVFSIMSMVAVFAAICVSTLDVVVHVARHAIEPVMLAFREVVSKPMSFVGRLDLPSLVAFLTDRLKPEYRDSWRTHGLSLAA